MLFRIDPSVLKEFPDVSIGLILAYNIDNSHESEEVKNLFEEQQKSIGMLDKDTLLEHPCVKAWQAAYKKSGINPKQYNSSIERLLRRIIKGEQLRPINTLVDLYNTISLKYCLPAGGEDLNAVRGDIHLSIASSNEPPVKLLGEADERPPKLGEVIYKDAISAIYRRWNWKEAERTKITPSTSHALLVLEALNPCKEQLEAATHELAALIERYCGGKVSVAIVNAALPQVTIKRDNDYISLNPISRDQSFLSKAYDRTEEPTAQTHEHVSTEHAIRIEKVKKLRALGIEPWPGRKEVTATTEQIIKDFLENENARHYAIAGRLMNIRLHGKAAFAQLQDISGQLQLYIKTDTIGKEAFHVFEHLIDIGDIIWCEGTSFRTKTGQITLLVETYTLLSKSLHPLPEKFHGLTHIETKYRQRYLDLITNPQAKERFIKRSEIIVAMRCYLDTHNYREVETPMLHPIAGGAAARPFITHYNALASDFYLRIAPELYLKRLVIGGFDRVYEINRNFRNEGISTRHNPEFTMLEFYTAYEDYHYSMNFVEDMLRTIILKISDSLQLPYGDYILDFSSFKRMSMKDAVLSYGKLAATDLEEKSIDAVLSRFSVKLDSSQVSVGEKIMALFETLVEPHLIQPTFIMDFPIETSPLSKRNVHNPAIAARFELFIAGMELANSYNELNDPFDQAERFREQLQAQVAGNPEAHQYDADFVRALEYGLPPTVGVGIGIDRLVMLLTNTPSIKEVIFFPTLKKKGFHE